MKQQDKELLESLGYSTTHKRMRLFNDIIDEVEECLTKYNYDEVKEIVKNKKSYIYVEVKMFYEVGLNRLQNELNIIHNDMRDFSKCDIEVYTDVFGSNLTPTVDETILSIASYKLNQKQKKISQELESPKILIKREQPSSIAFAM